MSAYEDLLGKITAPTITVENWEGILAFCDMVRSICFKKCINLFTDL